MIRIIQPVDTAMRMLSQCNLAVLLPRFSISSGTACHEGGGRLVYESIQRISCYSTILITHMNQIPVIYH